MVDHHTDDEVREGLYPSRADVHEAGREGCVARRGCSVVARAAAPRRDLHHHTLTARPRPLRSSALAEFKKVVIATGIGFLLMGFIGFFVKLIHIPINQIILGMGN